MVPECFNEETRRHSNGMTLEPLDESLRDVRRSSRSSLNVPGNIGSERRLSADDVEEVIASPPTSSEIRLEIPQADDAGKNTSPADSGDNIIQASTSDIHYSDSSPKAERKTNENVNALVISSLSRSVGTVHFMRPLAGVAWTKNSTNARAKSRSSLRSLLRPKMQHSENETGSRSAPSSPASSRSAKF